MNSSILHKQAEKLFTLFQQEHTMSGQFFAYFIGYNNDPGCQLADLATTGVDVAIAAFANITPDTLSQNTIDMGPDSLTKYYTEKQIRDGITAFHNNGKKVLLGINDNGGKGYWAQVDPQKFAANVAQIVSNWGFDGVDLDNEDGYSQQGAANFAAIVQNLRSALGTNAIISMPVFSGNESNLSLSQTKQYINYLYTMDYFDSYAGITQYVQHLEGIVGNIVAAGVGTPLATGGQSTPILEVGRLIFYQPKAGMMLWAANYSDAPAYIKLISGAVTESDTETQAEASATA